MSIVYFFPPENLTLFEELKANTTLRPNMLISYELQTDPDVFPINLLRNRAIDQVQTTHFWLADMDVWPSIHTYDVVRSLPKEFLWMNWMSELSQYFRTNDFINAPRLKIASICRYHNTWWRVAIIIVFLRQKQNSMNAKSGESVKHFVLVRISTAITSTSGIGITILLLLQNFFVLSRILKSRIICLSVWSLDMWLYVRQRELLGLMNDLPIMRSIRFSGWNISGIQVMHFGLYRMLMDLTFHIHRWFW